MALKILRDENLWFELSGNRFHQNDIAMVESFIAQLIYNADEDYGCSDDELDTNQLEFESLFGKFRSSRKRYLDQLNTFLQPYHLEIVIEKE